MNKKQEIPFCTHADLMNLKKADIEAIGIITYQANKKNYDLISEVEGFNSEGKIDNKNNFSYKKISRKDIHIKNLEIDFQMSNSTIKRHLKRLEKINIGNKGIPLIFTDKKENDIIYGINHKAYDKYYTLIDKDTLRKLLLINGTALKLYLVIKYHYEYSKSINKPCILDLNYLSNKVGLKDTGSISDILDIMEGTFTKRRMSYKNKIVVKNGKTQNVINKYYEYEIIQTFNDSMIPVQELDEDLDLPW